MFSSSSSLSTSMAGNGGFGDDPLAPGCYSQLLFGDEISGLETDGRFGFTSDDNNITNLNSPKMLCFGDYAKHYANAKKMDHKPGLTVTCMDDSSPTKNTNLNVIVLLPLYTPLSRSLSIDIWWCRRRETGRVFRMRVTVPEPRLEIRGMVRRRNRKSLLAAAMQR